MKLTENSGKEFEQAPIGSHVARCVKVIDLGTQKNEFEGKVTYPHQVAICWELPNELMQEGEWKGQPFVVSKIYTASLSEKATLRKHLQTWRGRDFTPDELKGFDSKNLLGKACMVSIIHSEKGKAKVEGVLALPRGMECPPQRNQNVYFSMDPAEFSRPMYEQLSQWYREKIAASPEWAELNGRKDPMAYVETAIEEMADDITF